MVGAEDLQRRPPVVTIMGHVDHVKTTLPIPIRKNKGVKAKRVALPSILALNMRMRKHSGNTQQIVSTISGHAAYSKRRERDGLLQSS